MSFENFKYVEPGEILAYVRADLRNAMESVLIIGPWLDDFFAEQVVAAAPKQLATRVLVRSKSEVDVLAWERTLAAISVFAAHWRSFESRYLERLHAKCVCIDGRTVYVGSANWYRYGLEKSLEVVIRGPAESIDGGIWKLESLWDQGNGLDSPSLPKARTDSVGSGSLKGAVLRAYVQVSELAISGWRRSCLVWHATEGH
jgi:hypothetical protein